MCFGLGRSESECKGVASSSCSFFVCDILIRLMGFWSKACILVHAFCMRAMPARQGSFPRAAHPFVLQQEFPVVEQESCSARD